jgi:hypothetical protein
MFSSTTYVILFIAAITVLKFILEDPFCLMDQVVSDNKPESPKLNPNPNFTDLDPIKVDMNGSLDRNKNMNKQFIIKQVTDHQERQMVPNYIENNVFLGTVDLNTIESYGF